MGQKMNVLNSYIITTENPMSDATPVDPMDNSKENSPVVIPSDSEATVIMDAAAKTCTWNGQTFPDGTEVSSEGAIYECSFGKWVKS